MSEQKQDEVPWWRNDPRLGFHLFAENREKNRDLLRQHEGKIVAWFPDGSGIRDADADSIALWDRIVASGDEPWWYYYEYCEPRRADVGAAVPWWRNDPWLGHHVDLANRYHNFEMLVPYEGKHVAWLPDGTGIRDADEDSYALWKRIEASGDDPQWYVFEYVERRS
jgi:hypothetical protein